MAGLLDSVAKNLLGRITEAAGRLEIWPIRRELRKLETTVSALKAVLRDAEGKQASHSKLTPLLKQLKDAFSDADDLFDDLECEYLKWRVQSRRNDFGNKVLRLSSCSSSNIVVSASKIANQINQIIERLDNIEKAMSEFPLVEEENEHIKRLKSEMSLRTSITGSQVFTRLLHSKKEAILSDDYDSIVGREEAKESIINSLLTHGDDKQQSPTILSIHGNGGMGKTTLAKLVYNADQVFVHFDKRMWVCVSEDFDLQRMRRELFSSATGEQVTDALTDRQLHIRLQRNLVGRKFLLVLDDFGALNPMRESKLQEIVKMGANGSKIIITTRSEQTLNDATTHKIERLDKKNSMVLFEHAFRNKTLPENLLKVEEEFVPKCGGAPLAIKCLAGLLSSEASDTTEWANVEDLKEKWRQVGVKDACVLPALRLSYDLMPSYLKPCFLCFSLLPKDYVFYSFELIQLWMAQGILHSSSKNPEVVGEQYFNELWSRGLLEDVEEHALGYWFKIHSLVHDLAVQQAGKEQENLGSLHHLSFNDSSNKDLLPSTSHKIRCLSVPVGGVEPKINGVPLVKCISKFRQLRLLYLCNSSLEEIPTSIDTLKHLRYLDLRGNRRLKRLPESICKLQSLQTLILAFCSELEELPRNIKNLISLRLLWITTKQATLGKDGIGRLTSLRFLAIGGSENLTHLFEDIDNLNSLQTLIIYDCKSLLTLPEGLQSLSGLCNMAIWGCEQLRFTFSLRSLRLKKLILRGFPALALWPDWIDDLDESLEMLEVGELPRLRILPFWLPNLAILRMLGISNCPSLEDRMPQDMQLCDELKELRITFCGSLSKKSMDQNNHENLEISHIPTIYVDSRRIRNRHGETNATEDSHSVGQSEGEKSDEATDHSHGTADQTEGVKHDGATDDGHVRTGQTEGVKHDDAMGQTEGVKHDGATDDGHVETGQIEGVKHDGAMGQTEGVKHNGATDDGHVRTGQTEGVKHDGVMGQTEGVKHDGATDDGHVGTGQTEGVKHDGAMGQTEGVKHDGATDDGHVGTCQTEGVKHDGAMGQTEGIKHDGATDDGHVGIGQTEGVKHDSAIGQTEGVKHDGATDDGHVGTGQIEGVKHDGAVGQTEGVKHNGATDDGHVGTGQIEGVKYDGAMGQTEGVKHDGATDDGHVGTGQTEGVKHDGATDVGHVEAGQNEGVKNGGTTNNDHTRVCLGDDGHARVGQTMVITLEGF